MNQRYLIAWAVLAALGISAPAFADVVLLASTASIGGQPQTTARLVDINLATGAASNPRDTGIYAMAGIAVQPSTGNIFGLTTNPSAPSNMLVTIDRLTGVPTVVGSTGLPFIIEGDLAFNPVNGMLYGLADLGTDVLHRNFFQINPATGAATIISNLPNNSNSSDYNALAFDSAGTLYCIDQPSGGPSVNSRLLTIDPVFGAIESNVAMNVRLGGAIGMAFDPTTGIAYVADGGTMPGPTNMLCTLDVNSAVLGVIGPVNFTGGISGLTFTAVPEPSSLILALPLIGAMKWRDKLWLPGQSHTDSDCGWAHVPLVYRNDSSDDTETPQFTLGRNRP